MNELLDWTWTAVMLGATALWLLFLRRESRHCHHRPTDARILSTATVIVVCVLMLASSLLYADLITVETSRYLINGSRIALLVGGVAVLWASRRKEVPTG